MPGNFNEHVKGEVFNMVTDTNAKYLVTLEANQDMAAALLENSAFLEVGFKSITTIS